MRSDRIYLDDKVNALVLNATDIAECTEGSAPFNLHEVDTILRDLEAIREIAMDLEDTFKRIWTEIGGD